MPLDPGFGDIGDGGDGGFVFPGTGGSQPTIIDSGFVSGSVAFSANVLTGDAGDGQDTPSDCPRTQWGRVILDPQQTVCYHRSTSDAECKKADCSDGEGFHEDSLQLVGSYCQPPRTLQGGIIIFQGNAVEPKLPLVAVGVMPFQLTGDDPEKRQIRCAYTATSVTNQRRDANNVIGPQGLIKAQCGSYIGLLLIVEPPPSVGLPGELQQQNALDFACPDDVTRAYLAGKEFRPVKEYSVTFKCHNCNKFL